MEIQSRGQAQQDLSTQASAISRQSPQMQGDLRSNLSSAAHQKRGLISRPQSIQQRNASLENLKDIEAPSYRGGSRADQSALEHIRRIRRNLPS